jgi:Ca2+-binding RTX toxin-like protein
LRTLWADVPETFRTLLGGSGSDTLTGNASDNVILGGAGGDTIYGGLGDDRLEGGSQNDQLHGGAGADELIGGAGDDGLFGEAGSDVLRGGYGSDALHGGSGADQYVFDPALGGAESDTLTESGSDVDVIDFGLTAEGVTLNLDTGSGSQVGGRSISLSTPGLFENVIGSIGDDHLAGNNLNNVLTGGLGDDWIDGGAGGNDRLIGGLGDDTYHFTNSSADVDKTIVEEPGEGTDTLDFSALPASRPVEADLNGIRESFFIFSWQTDKLATYGNVVVRVPDRVDALQFENLLGGAGNDRLTGNRLANRIEGGAGDDVIRSLAGDDVLTGGAGSDILDGGGDDDTYLFSDDDFALAGFDTVVESRGQVSGGVAIDGGVDTLDFSAVSMSPVTYNPSSPVQTVASSGSERIELHLATDIAGTGNATAFIENVVGAQVTADALAGPAPGASLMGPRPKADRADSSNSIDLLAWPVPTPIRF